MPVEVAHISPNTPWISAQNHPWLILAVGLEHFEAAYNRRSPQPLFECADWVMLILISSSPELACSHCTYSAQVFSFLLQLAPNPTRPAPLLVHAAHLSHERAHENCRETVATARSTSTSPDPLCPESSLSWSGKPRLLLGSSRLLRAHYGGPEGQGCLHEVGWVRRMSYDGTSKMY